MTSIPWVSSNILYKQGLGQKQFRVATKVNDTMASSDDYASDLNKNAEKAH